MSPALRGKKRAANRRARACPSPCIDRGGNPLACACGMRGPPRYGPGKGFPRDCSGSGDPELQMGWENDCRGQAPALRARGGFSACAVRDLAIPNYRDEKFAGDRPPRYVPIILQIVKRTSGAKLAKHPLCPYLANPAPVLLKSCKSCSSLANHVPNSADVTIIAQIGGGNQR